MHRGKIYKVSASDFFFLGFAVSLCDAEYIAETPDCLSVAWWDVSFWINTQTDL